MVKLRLVKKNPAKRIEIRYLAEAPKAVPKLVDLFLDEWEPYYGSDGPGIAEADIWECCQTSSLPLALVAIDGNGEVVGTGALKAGSVGSEPGQGPWIAALVVEKSRRGNGIGTALIAALESEARSFRYSFLYTSTDTAGSILLNRGWQALNQASSLRGPITVYRAKLQD